MDENLDRIMEHEKHLSALVADGIETTRKEIDELIRQESARANNKKDEARSEAEKRRKELFNCERERQEVMTRELEDHFSRLALNADITGLIRETVLDYLFRGGGGM